MASFPSGLRPIEVAPAANTIVERLSIRIHDRNSANMARTSNACRYWNKAHKKGKGESEGNGTGAKSYATQSWFIDYIRVLSMFLFWCHGRGKATGIVFLSWANLAIGIWFTLVGQAGKRRINTFIGSLYGTKNL
jgi:hypothetical protein